MGNREAPTAGTNGVGFEATLWAATSGDTPIWPALNGAARAEVAVVGAGYTGLSTALHLAEKGVDVVLLEAHEPGWGSSGRNMGGCVGELVIGHAGILRARHGEEMAGRICRLIDDSADIVRRVVGRLDDDCDLRFTGFLNVAHRADKVELLRTKFQNLRERNIAATWLDGPASAAVSGSPFYRHGGYLLENAGILNPLKFVRALARAANKQGVRLFAQSPVRRIEPNAGRWRLRTESGEVDAARIVLAQNVYSGGLWPGLDQATIPLVGWVGATQPLTATMAAQILPQGQMLGDTHPGIYFFRKTVEDRLLVPLQEDLNLAGGHPSLRATESFMRRVFPQLGEVRFDYVWNGTASLTPGELPKLVQLADGVWAGFGYLRGLALSVAMGEILAAVTTGTPPDQLPLPVSPLKPVPMLRVLKTILPRASRIANALSRPRGD